MMGETPFNPSYKSTKQITVDTTSAGTIVDAESSQLLLTNVGTNVVFVRVAPTATAAQLNADLPILPSAAVLITRDGSFTHVSAIAAAAGNTLHITTGEGA